MEAVVSQWAMLLLLLIPPPPLQSRGGFGEQRPPRSSPHLHWALPPPLKQ